MTASKPGPVEVIDLGPGADGVEAVEVPSRDALEGAELVSVGERGLALNELSLDDLRDVDAPPGDLGVLTRSAPGETAHFAPTPRPPDLSYRHTQVLESDTWLINHGLTFTPAAVAVVGEAGQQLHPRRVAHPALGRTRLEFTRPVIGTADLS